MKNNIGSRRLLRAGTAHAMKKKSIYEEGEIFPTEKPPTYYGSQSRILELS
jgi:hypothetical protein